jgi:hypothetical protein
VEAGNRMKLRIPHHYAFLIRATFVVGAVVEVVGYLIEPDGGRRFVGFAVVYGWLGLFFALAQVIPTKNRTLTIIGGVPLLLLALISIVLSFPIYVIPAVILLLAVSRTKDSVEE